MELKIHGMLRNTAFLLKYESYDTSYLQGKEIIVLPLNRREHNGEQHSPMEAFFVEEEEQKCTCIRVCLLRYVNILLSTSYHPGVLAFSMKNKVSTMKCLMSWVQNPPWSTEKRDFFSPVAAVVGGCRRRRSPAVV